MKKLFRRLLDLLRLARRAVGFLFCFLLMAWATLAIHFSNLPGPWARTALAVGFGAFGVWALWFTAKPSAKWAFATGCLVVFIGWLTIHPSHDRVWEPEVAVLPRAVVAGDQVRLLNCRNFAYRTVDDFDLRYEAREVLLSHLTGVDLFVSYWMPGPAAHTFVSFTFDNAPPVCISIEARPELGHEFTALATLFKQYHLIYVVGDECDLVGVRTKHRPEEVYRYSLRTSPEGARRLFLVYLDRINQLAEQPEFYHLLANSCTVNIVRYARAAGRPGSWDIRHVLNGYIDRFLYREGLIETNVPFAEVRRAARINDLANAALAAPDFSQRIRGAGAPAPARP